MYLDYQQPVLQYCHKEFVYSYRSGVSYSGFDSWNLILSFYHLSEQAGMYTGSHRNKQVTLTTTMICVPTAFTPL